MDDEFDNFPEPYRGNAYAAMYEWTLPNFFFNAMSPTHALNKNKEIYSLGFSALNRKWKLRLHSNKRKENAVGLVVTLHGQLLTDESMELEYSLSILSQPGGELLSRCHFQHDFSDGKPHGGLVITKEMLLEKQRELMLTGNLTIHCEFYQMRLTESKFEKHQKKMLQLLKNGMDSDITIRTSNSQQFRVHKIFLCMYSNVFNQIINDKRSFENETDEITIDCDSSEAVESMLKYIYSGRRSTFENVNAALKVLDLAEKYNIVQLRNDCIHYLYISIDVDNVITILIYAEKYNHPDIKHHALNIIDQHLKDVIQTEGFIHLPHEYHYLLKEILKRVAE